MLLRTRKLAAFVMFLSAVAASADSPYHLLKKIPVAGEGGFDYLTLDAEGRRLYISRGDRVIAFDVEKENVAGEIPKTKGVHGVALALKHGRGYTSNGGDSTSTIFDLKTLQETGRVKVGSRPDAIIYDDFTDQVFTLNAGDSTATAITAATGAVAGTVALEARPEFAVSDGKGRVYVNLLGKNEIAVIDATKLTVVNRFPLGEGQNPTGLAMDRAKRRLFSGCRNEKMVVMSADDGRIVDTLPIGKGVDACSFDPTSGMAFCSNGDGTINVVEEQSAGRYAVTATIPTQVGAKTMALDTKTHNIYLVTARYKAGDPGKRGGRRTAEPNSFVVLLVGK